MTPCGLRGEAGSGHPPVRHWFPVCGLCFAPLYQRTPQGTTAHGAALQQLPLGRCSVWRGCKCGSTVSCPERATCALRSHAQGPQRRARSHSPAGRAPMGHTSWESHVLLPPCSLQHARDTAFVKNRVLHICLAAAAQQKSLWARLGDKTSSDSLGHIRFELFPARTPPPRSLPVLLGFQYHFNSQHTQMSKPGNFSCNQRAASCGAASSSSHGPSQLQGPPLANQCQTRGAVMGKVQ